MECKRPCPWVDIKLNGVYALVMNLAKSMSCKAAPVDYLWPREKLAYGLHIHGKLEGDLRLHRRQKKSSLRGGGVGNDGGADFARDAGFESRSKSNGVRLDWNRENSGDTCIANPKRKWELIVSFCDHVSRTWHVIHANRVISSDSFNHSASLHCKLFCHHVKRVAPCHVGRAVFGLVNWLHPMTCLAS